MIQPGMTKPVFMAVTVLLLLTLVVVTPQFIGPQEDISSRPRLILNYDQGTLIAFVTSLSGTYIYPGLFLNITPSPGLDPVFRNATRAMALEERIPLDLMSSFRLEAEAEDGIGQLFGVGLDVEAVGSAEGWTLRLILEPGPPRTYTGQDLRNTPFATLLERRDAP